MRSSNALFYPSLLVAFLIADGHVLSAPVNIPTTPETPNFFSLLYSSNESCFVPYVDVNDQDYVSTKINTMCNPFLSREKEKQFQPTGVCVALRDLMHFPSLCSLSVAMKLNGTVEKRKTVVDFSKFKSQSLDGFCTSFTNVTFELSHKSGVESRILPWDKEDSGETERNCVLRCKNTVTENLPDDNYSVHPACLLLYEGYNLYLNATSFQNQNVSIQSPTLESPPSNENTGEPELSQPSQNQPALDTDTIPLKSKKSSPSVKLSTTDRDTISKDLNGTKSVTSSSKILDSVTANNFSNPDKLELPSPRPREGVVNQEEASDQVKSRTTGLGIAETSSLQKSNDGKIGISSPLPELRSSDKPALENGSLKGDVLLSGKERTEKTGITSSSSKVSKSQNKSSSTTTTTTTSSNEAGNNFNDLLEPPNGIENSKTSTSTPSIVSNAVDDSQKLSKSITVAIANTEAQSKVFGGQKKLSSLENKNPALKQNAESDAKNSDDDMDLADLGEEDSDITEDELNNSPGNKKSNVKPKNEEFGYGNLKDSSRGRFGNTFNDELFPDHETTIHISVNETEESGFFSYFMFCVILFGILYLVVHNKKKLIAYVVEGRRPRSRSRRSSSSEYRRLENNYD